MNRLTRPIETITRAAIAAGLVVGLASPAAAQEREAADSARVALPPCPLERVLEERPPPPEPSIQRRAHCQSYVEASRRGMGLQVAVVHRDGEAELAPARDCLIDDANPLESCLRPAELANLNGLVNQRLAECGAWPESLAACILELPGRADCDPDTYPLWREPVDAGEPGLRAAWQLSTGWAEWEPVPMAWAGNGDLIVAGEGVRRVCGQQERWRVEGSASSLHVVGDRALVQRDGELVVLNLESGSVVTTLRDGAMTEHVVAGPDARLLLLTYDGVRAVELAACRNPSCVVPYAPMAGLDLFLESPDNLDVTADRIRVVGDEGLAIYAPGGTTPELTISARIDATAVFLSQRHVALADGTGTAIVDLPACTSLGARVHLPFAAAFDSSVRGSAAECAGCVPATRACVVAWQTDLASDLKHLVAVGPRAVAWNDEGIAPSTRLLRVDGAGWDVATRGMGPVVSDGQRVYVFAPGQEEGETHRLLALSASDGRTLWSTTLPSRLDPYTLEGEIGMTLGDDRIALSVGGEVVVIPLPLE